ncbi:hypothetical protein PtA15_8A39 [Puccinia triticina]|uniref:RxLR effector protein n=1 Tax=Puccinia triticina TaxID=208348 RepID=A0ABY7CQC5_9BASI|nr:uncharacterized protein PtA15_8A39 [Puccinia triticina]WAQ87138.1 hypothetical protein PtA15_8A39 [Puccinia triticina]
MRFTASIVLCLTSSICQLVERTQGMDFFSEGGRALQAGTRSRTEAAPSAANAGEEGGLRRRPKNGQLYARLKVLEDADARAFANRDAGSNDLHLVTTDIAATASGFKSNAAGSSDVGWENLLYYPFEKLRHDKKDAQADLNEYRKIIADNSAISQALQESIKSSSKYISPNTLKALTEIFYSKSLQNHKRLAVLAIYYHLLKDWPESIVPTEFTELWDYLHPIEIQLFKDIRATFRKA